ncbi:hypothetical protein SY91_05375 [Burkholderia cenocepacia]|nr:hypothetical protein SY91_05375 [Burkholderia cenocepacia]
MFFLFHQSRPPMFSASCSVSMRTNARASVAPREKPNAATLIWLTAGMWFATCFSSSRSIQRMRASPLLAAAMPSAPSIPLPESPTLLQGVPTPSTYRPIVRGLALLNGTWANIASLAMLLYLVFATSVEPLPSSP